MAALDHVGYLRWHHILPRRVMFFDTAQNVTRENVQHGFIERHDLLDPAAVDQMAVETAQVVRYQYVIRRSELSGRMVPERINVNSQVLDEQLAERLQNSAFE